MQLQINWDETTLNQDVQGSKIIYKFAGILHPCEWYNPGPSVPAYFRAVQVKKSFKCPKQLNKSNSIPGKNKTRMASCTWSMHLRRPLAEVNPQDEIYSWSLLILTKKNWSKSQSPKLAQRLPKTTPVLKGPFSHCI